MFDYSQRSITEEYEKGWDKIFKEGIMDVGKPLDHCHWENGGKTYVCACSGNICKKNVGRK